MTTNHKLQTKKVQVPQQPSTFFCTPQKNVVPLHAKRVQNKKTEYQKS